MPVSPEFVTKACARLSEVRPVTFKKMFGGLGFYCEGEFFAVGDDDKICFKVDERTVASYEERGMGPWMMGGQENPAYRELPQEIFDDLGRLGEWIDAAVEVSRRKKVKKK